LSGRRKKILFDQTQNERGRLESTYSELGQMLRDNDFDVEAYTEFMILAKNLKNVDVLVFGCPNSSKVRPAEIDVLQKYVQEGGSLLLLSLSGGDRGLMNNMSKISGEFGITFENTAVKDERSNAGLPTMPIITDVVAHPATEDVADLLIPSACSLKISGKAHALATTSATAEPGKAPIVAIAEIGKGKVMCIGSYEVFRRGGGLKHKGNAKFALNSFKWLTGGLLMAKPSAIVKEQEKAERKGKEVEKPAEESTVEAEFEKTLKRLVNAVFDLQKDIAKVREEVANVDNNIEMLRNQFQDFAEKTQQQLGVMIPAKQFKTADESRTTSLQGDLKALKKEMKSVEELRRHIEQRHTSGAMPDETYNEQVAKLEDQIETLKARIDGTEKELESLSGQS
jgi:prefoldin subunit 5